MNCIQNHIELHHESEERTAQDVHRRPAVGMQGQVGIVLYVGLSEGKENERQISSVRWSLNITPKTRVVLFAFVFYRRVPTRWSFI